MTSYHVSHESNQPQGPSPYQPIMDAPPPPYPPMMEAPPPPYPPTLTRSQDYYSGYGQLQPPPLYPSRSDEYYGEREYEGCFPFLRTCLTTLCCCWIVERCCFPSRY